MKVIIFGASSATGRHLVDKALAAGHEVTAFVRDVAKLGVPHGSLQVIEGDALNAVQVEQALKGHDAVLSTLGPKGKPAVMASESTRNIIDGMEKHGIKRLVLISVAGVAVPQDQRGRSVVDSLLKFFLKDIFTDRENQLAVLEASSIDWIAVRVPRLTDDPDPGSVRAFFGKPSPALKVSRAGLADFMLAQLNNDQWLRQAPILSQ